MNPIRGAVMPRERVCKECGKEFTFRLYQICNSVDTFCVRCPYCGKLNSYPSWLYFALQRRRARKDEKAKLLAKKDEEDYQRRVHKEEDRQKRREARKGQGSR